MAQADINEKLTDIALQKWQLGAEMTPHEFQLWIEFVRTTSPRLAPVAANAILPLVDAYIKALDQLKASSVKFAQDLSAQVSGAKQ